MRVKTPAIAQKRLIALLAITVVAAIGTLLLSISLASTPTASFEPESGTYSGVTIINDPTASGSKAVKFSAAATAHTTPCGWTTAATSYKHIIWIWNENKDASVVTGGAPYFDTVAGQCASLAAVQDSATTLRLPSEPQYAAATSGSNCNTGITSNSGSGSGCISDDNDGHSLTTQSIFQLAKSSGGSWKSYQEGMPANCAQTSGGTKYAFKHNPAAFYTQIRSDCASLDIPIAAISCPTASNQVCSAPSNQLVTDINAGTLPTFSFITPNLQNDMHDGTVAQGDNWLHTYVPLIVNGPNYKAGNTAIFLMWDEGSGSGAPIPTAVIAPTIPAKTVISTSLNNIGLLRTTQDALGLTPYLGCASGTPPGGTGSCNPGSNVSIRSQLHL